MLGAADFDALALEVFKFQYRNVSVYRQFCDGIGRGPDRVLKVEDIPFLPVQFFKTFDIIAEGLAPEKIFGSSTTTGAQPSRHLVADLGLYTESYRKAFNRFYGDMSGTCLLALLPSYMERGTSSLLYMADDLIRISANPLSGFILNEMDTLRRRILAAQAAGQPVILLGVTYALLDFAEQQPMDLSGAIIMETGGMKGRRAEMTREEVHRQLKEAFRAKVVHSEYGMTELLSQAYSKGEGIFSCPPWMRVLARDIHDPLSPMPAGRTGALNIIDLANLYSCSFIAVDDLGRVYEDGRFEVMGRLDSAEIRGCNLMYDLG